MNDLPSRLAEALGAGDRIERELGGGGMSHVFVATELSLGRPVVVKVLPPELPTAVSVDRFRREIQTAQEGGNSAATSRSTWRTAR